MNNAPELSVLIVNYKAGPLLRECLQSIYTGQEGVSLEGIVIDNASPLEDVAFIPGEFPQVKLAVNRHNLGFSRAYNQAIRQARGEFLLLLNPDTTVHPGALSALVSFMKKTPDCGALGAKLLNPDGSVQLSCRNFPSHRTALFSRHSLLTRLFPRNRFSQEYLLSGLDHESPHQVEWVSGACLLTRRKVVEEVGLLDEGYFMYAEDVDWCYRMSQAGWKTYYCPEAVVSHHVGQSSQTRPFRSLIARHRSMWHFYRKHYKRQPKLLDIATFLGITLRCLFLLSLQGFRQAGGKLAAVWRGKGS